MPIVHVELFPGRSETIKASLARRIVDAVAEVAGCSREGVHVIFDEVRKDDWALGPRLASQRKPGSVDNSVQDAYLVVSSLHVEPSKRDAYLAWRRDSVYPYMASSEGFVSSNVIALDDKPADYLIINKWLSRQAQDNYIHNPREEQLRVEAKQFMDELVTPVQAGDVVNVFHGGWGKKQ
jgi:4-oxalocrotonate tautomerase